MSQSNYSIELSDIHPSSGSRSPTNTTTTNAEYQQMMLQKRVDFNFAKPDRDNSVGETSFSFTTKDLGEEDEVTEEDMATFFLNQVKEFYIDNIPVQTLKDLPGFWKYSLGAVAYLIFYIVFAFFFYTNFQDAIKKAFISLESDAGDCSTVPISISGTYLADSKGNWIGTSKFEYYLAPYNFVFSNLEAKTKLDYENMMDTFDTSLIEIGEKAKTQNLALNLVYWISYARFYSMEYPELTDFRNLGSGKLQYLELAGSPAVVFNTPIFGSVISGHEGNCDAKVKTSYDQANAQMSVTLNVTSLKTITNCITAAGDTYTYDLISGEEEIDFALDVRTFSTALAVNLGIVDIGNLGLATSETFQITFKGIQYEMGQYFDIRYSEMAPIYCLRSKTTLSTGVNSLCFASQGTLLFLPVFNHIGESWLEPTYCQCSEAGHLDVCNDFLLATTLVYFPVAGGSSISSAITQQLQSLFTLYSMYPKYENFNRAAYNASVTSILTHFGTGDTAKLSSAQWLTEVYKFCKLPNGKTCSLINFYGINKRRKTVSNYQYQLVNGSCSDTITIAPEQWAELRSIPPVDLNQQYYECYQSTWNAFLNAVGIASGNSSIAMIFILLISLPFLYLGLALIRQIPPPEEYSDRQRKMTLDAFSTLLLRIRDQNYTGVKKTGTLSSIVKELMIALKDAEGLSALSRDEITEDERNVQMLKRIDSILSDHGDVPESPTSKQPQAQRGLGLSPVPMRRMVSSREVNHSHKPKIAHRRRSSTGITKIEHDLKASNVFMGIKILNMVEEDPAVINTISDEFRSLSLDNLLGSMMKYLSLALKEIDEACADSDDEELSADGSQSGNAATVLAPEKMARRNKQRQVIIATNMNYKKAVMISTRLKKWHSKQIMHNSDPTVLVRLSNILCMHASIDSGVDMRDIAITNGDVVGYDIGGELLTYTVLTTQSMVPTSP